MLIKYTAEISDAGIRQLIADALGCEPGRITFKLTPGGSDQREGRSWPDTITARVSSDNPITAK